MGGFVYVMTNYSMPGMVKIGFTTRMPTSRADELFTSRVPCPFEVFSAIWFDDPKSVESEIHEHFDICRVTEGREFFRLTPEVATQRIVETLLQSIDCDSVVVGRWAYVDTDALEDFADVRGVHPADIGEVVSQDLKEFVKRKREVRSEEGQYHECLSIA